MSAGGALRTVGEVVLVGTPALTLVTRALGLRAVATIAVLQDAMPLVLGLAWPGLVIALATGSWNVAAVAAVIGVLHVRELRRLRHRDDRPRWAEHAPTVKVGVANVYVDNRERTRCASQLASLDVDVLIVVETTPEFRADFDAAGGAARFPARTFDPDDHGAYAVSLYARNAACRPSMIDIGPTRVASVTLHVGGTPLQVVGAIPMAAVDPGGYRRWLDQTAALARYARRAHHPLVIAGDLNTTIHRAAFAELSDAGLADAHDALGLGLRPSFRLAARGILAKLGPVVRLDHALLSDGVWPLDVVDLDAVGSDHQPFVATLAVRRASRRPARASTSSPTAPGDTEERDLAAAAS